MFLKTRKIYHCGYLHCWWAKEPKDKIETDIFPQWVNGFVKSFVESFQGACWCLNEAQIMEPKWLVGKRAKSENKNRHIITTNQQFCKWLCWVFVGRMLVSKQAVVWWAHGEHIVSKRAKNRNRIRLISTKSQQFSNGFLSCFQGQWWYLKEPEMMQNEG